MQVSGAQRRLMVHNVALYHWSGAQCRFHERVRQMDGQTDRLWCTGAHLSLAQVGSKIDVLLHHYIFLNLSSPPPPDFVNGTIICNFMWHLSLRNVGLGFTFHHFYPWMVHSREGGQWTNPCPAVFKKKKSRLGQHWQRLIHVINIIQSKIFSVGESSQWMVDGK